MLHDPPCLLWLEHEYEGYPILPTYGGRVLLCLWDLLETGSAREPSCLVTLTTSPLLSSPFPKSLLHCKVGPELPTCPKGLFTLIVPVSPSLTFSDHSPLLPNHTFPCVNYGRVALLVNLCPCLLSYLRKVSTTRGFCPPSCRRYFQT